MTKVINCECGVTLRAETDDELVAQAEEHIGNQHPEMAGSMSRDDVLAMAEEQPQS
jgi:predicted small metal-binding protein